MNDKTIQRTVQFWRLVDGRTNALLTDVDWEKCFRSRIGEHFSYKVDEIMTSGTVHSYQSEDFLEFIDNIPAGTDLNIDRELSPIGIVLSVAKDFVPNQELTNSGKQKPVQLEGDGWEPVDNLFVYHLPFANMIAVLAESVSSARAMKYANWLNRFFYDQKMTDPNDPDFRWAAIPVVDDEAREKLNDAEKLKAFVFAGKIGERVSTPANGLARLFAAPANQPNGIKVEIKVSLDRADNSQGDGEKLLEWFTDSFGDLDGATKAQVKTVQSGGSINEVDLINQRITRKQAVALGDSAVKVISAKDAFTAIHRACTADAEDLYRLRSIS